MLRLLSLAFSGAVLVAGCGDDDGARTDAGRVWMPMDSGIPPRPDAGAPDTAIPRQCFRFDEPAFPRCRAATRDCVPACPEGDPGNDCRDACWASDTYPRTEAGGCSDCIFAQLFRCLEAAGCEAQSAEYLCCIADCGAGGDPCIQSMCQSQSEAFFLCGFYNAPSCFDVVGGEIGECYATEDPDAGTADAGEPDASEPDVDAGT